MERTHPLIRRSCPGRRINLKFSDLRHIQEAGCAKLSRYKEASTQWIRNQESWASLDLAHRAIVMGTDNGYLGIRHTGDRIECRP